jgi:pyrimidine-specific ribonucleoside hydrolase
MPTPVLLDVDPGHDDAIAMLLALGSEALDVQAVTTVAGNQTSQKVTANAAKVLTVAGAADVPFASGMDRPMVRGQERIGAPEVHGESGLDGPNLPAPTVDPVPEHGIDMIRRLGVETEDGLTLVPVGPLSNVGMALRQYPELEEELAEIVLMGGAAGAGNYTPAAEFNIFVDPEAAQLVFDADISVTMVGLGVTREAVAIPGDIQRIRSLGGVVAETVADWLDYFHEWHLQQYDRAGVPIHDALAVAHLLDDSILTTEHRRVDVETSSDQATGRTVVDRYGVTERDANVDVAVAVDRDRFIELLIDTLEVYGS